MESLFLDGLDMGATAFMLLLDGMTPSAPYTPKPVEWNVHGFVASEWSQDSATTSLWMEFSPDIQPDWG